MLVENNSVLQPRAECRAVVARLDDSATTTLLGPSDTILGDAISLWHPRGGGGEPPLQRASGRGQLGCVVKIEASNVIPRTTKVLHRLICVVSGFGSFRVDCST